LLVTGATNGNMQSVAAVTSHVPHARASQRHSKAGGSSANTFNVVLGSIGHRASTGVSIQMQAIFVANASTARMGPTPPRSTHLPVGALGLAVRTI